MTDYNVLSDTDRTSWTRIMMVFRFFYPRLRWQIICYPIVSAVVFLLFVLLYHYGHFMKATYVVGILGYMVALAPLVLATRDDFEMETALPANGIEKFIFYIGYFLIVIPLLVYIPAELLSIFVYGELYNTLITSQLPVNIADFGISGSLTLLSSIVSNGTMIMICLLTVAVSRTNRLLKGIMFPLLTTLVIGLVTGVAAIMYTISSMHHNDMLQDNPMEFSTHLVQMISYPLTFIFSILFIVTLFMFWRKAINRQV